MHVGGVSTCKMSKYVISEYCSLLVCLSLFFQNVVFFTLGVVVVYCYKKIDMIRISKFGVEEHSYSIGLNRKKRTRR